MPSALTSTLTVIEVARDDEIELLIGGNSTLQMVVQLTSAQAHKLLADELTTQVVDLARALDDQRACAGQYSLGVGQNTE
ncbi:hypothetical protein D3C85_1392320 [compost metagenome]